MADFLDERISDLIRYGSSWDETFAVTANETAAGDSFRAMVHPYPKRIFDASYMLDSAHLWTELVNVYMRAHGTFAGFRARCFDEWSSNGPKGTPTAFDQPALYVSPGVYQLRKFYGTDKAAGASGYPFRLIKKPVAGTVRAAIGGIEMAKNALTWDVDTTTGLLSFPANGSALISGITKAAQAVISFLSESGPHYPGQTVHISGVSGMTQINGLRAMIVSQSAGQITIDLNTTAFSTYTSGGSFNTRPQTGESVTAGFEFDFPIRFLTTLPVGMDYPGYRPVESLRFEELLNP